MTALSFPGFASEFAAGFAAGRTDEAFAGVVARDAFFLDANDSTEAPDEAASVGAALPSAGAVASASDTGALFAGIPAEVTGASLATRILSDAAGFLGFAPADFQGSQCLNQAVPTPSTSSRIASTSTARSNSGVEPPRGKRHRFDFGKELIKSPTVCGVSTCSAASPRAGSAARLVGATAPAASSPLSRIAAVLIGSPNSGIAEAG